MKNKKEIIPVYASSGNFEPYGWIMEEPQRNADIENGEIKYWHSIIPFKGFSENQIINYFITKKRPPVCHSLECILNNNEAYINIGESRFVLFVASSTSDSEPDIDDLKAFIFKPGHSPVVKKGIWHWAPMPLDCDNRFLLLISGDDMLATEQGLGINTDSVLVKKLDCSYKAVFEQV